MAQNPGDELIANIKSIPKKTADTLTGGPQRRAGKHWATDAYAKASAGARKQWDEFKQLTAKPAAKASPRKRG